MPDSVRVRYRARDGTDHRVTIGRTAEGRWHVLDSSSGPATVVETGTAMTVIAAIKQNASDADAATPNERENTGTAKRPKNKNKTDGSWRQTIEARKVASPEATIRARSTLTKSDEAR